MNRKRREKKQAEAFGYTPVKVDIETRCMLPPDYKSQLIDATMNPQMALYALAARESFPDRDLAEFVTVTGRYRWSKSIFDETTTMMSAGTKAHQTLEMQMHDYVVMDEVDYTPLTVADYKWLEERMLAQISDAIYGINPPKKKTVDKYDQLATSTAPIKFHDL